MNWTAAFVRNANRSQRPNRNANHHSGRAVWQDNKITGKYALMDQYEIQNSGSHYSSGARTQVIAIKVCDTYNNKSPPPMAYTSADLCKLYLLPQTTHKKIQNA